MNRTLPAALLAVALAAACSARAAEYSAHKADLVEHRMERVRADDPLVLAHAAEADEVLAYGDDGDDGDDRDGAARGPRGRRRKDGAPFILCDSCAAGWPPARRIGAGNVTAGSGFSEDD
jgi:hypothetical protein